MRLSFRHGSVFPLRDLIRIPRSYRWYFLCLSSLFVVALFGLATETARATTTASSTAEVSEATTTELPEPMLAEESTAEIATATSSAINQTRVVNLAANISNHQEAMLGRLTHIHTRLLRRLDSLRAAEEPVVAARRAANEAAAELSAARATLRDIDLQIAGFVSAANPQVVWPEVRAIYETSQAELERAYESLRLSAALASAPAPLAPVATSTEAALEETE